MGQGMKRLGMPIAALFGVAVLALIGTSWFLNRDALRRLLAAGIVLEGASDHGVSEALYLRDPDQNGVELYWDRPKQEWPRTKDGTIAMFTHPLDLQALLQESGA